MIIETKRRSILKALSWRATATITTIVLVYAFTGQMETALTVGGIEVFAKMALYYFHERGWGKIRFGKREISPSVIWVTGLPRSGKEELSRAIYDSIKEKGLKVEYLDGKTIRELIPQLGFTKAERIEHVQRVGILVKTLEQNGIFVIANLVSPDRSAREFVRSLSRHFLEVYVSTPLAACEKRDSSRIYEKARRGEIANMVGVHFDYEPSESPEYSVDLSVNSVEQTVKAVIGSVESRF